MSLILTRNIGQDIVIYNKTNKERYSVGVRDIVGNQVKISLSFPEYFYIVRRELTIKPDFTWER